MKIEDLKPGLLVRDGTTILQISHVYSKLVTARVLAEGRPLAAPARDSVRTYTADEVAGFKPAAKTTKATLDKLYRSSK